MIITCKKEAASLVIERLNRENISCTQVGEMKEKDFGIKLIEAGKETDLIYHEEDPYWAAFFKAYNSGWK
jgi:hydrogenase maturation factor